MAVRVQRVDVDVYASDSVYLDDGTDITTSHSEHDSLEIWQPVDQNDLLGVAVDFEITKSKDEEQLVSGWASVAINKDGSLPLDWDDDVISPEVLEKAALDFMMNSQLSGEKHTGDAKGIVVESIVMTKEKQEAMGIPEGTVPIGWFITVKMLDADVYAKCKSGVYKMFSIQGKSKHCKL